MQTIWVKRKSVLGAALAVAAIYLLLAPKKYDHKASIILPKTHPNDVWEFVADFSNVKYLNPTITHFNILSESGNYDHWRYSVEYTENLSHWPYLANSAVAYFDVKSVPKKDAYYILSSHRTCLFLGFVCLKSTSEFKFTKSGPNTGALCEEQVQYQCPPLMSGFCEREVKFQRTAIMTNLKEYFKNK